jgi:intraflagellar transport protein 172
MARRIAQTMKFGDSKDKIFAKIDRMEKEYLEKKGDAGGLAAIGDEKGLQMLLEKGDYEQCLQAASEISEEMYNKYIINIVKKYLDKKNLAGTADFLEKHNTPIYVYNLKLYEEIAMEILADENLEELKALNSMLNCVNRQLKGLPEFQKEYKNMMKLNNIALYQFIKFTMKEKKASFPKSFWRVCETVLAFGDIIKFDLALYDAGMACRDAGQKGNAFLMLNRYLDVYDEIKDPESKIDDEPALQDTDFNFTQNAFKSTNNIIDEKEREEIYQWILDTGVDKSFEKVLNKKSCPKCKKPNFEANTYCHFCKTPFEICVITGAPIYPNDDVVKCSQCGRKGIKECWREWVGLFQTCPNCQSVQMSYK